MTAPTSNPTCPVTGFKGHVVKDITLKMLLKPDAYEQVKGIRMLYCEDPNCDVVYFSDDGNLLFYQNNLQVPVGLKGNGSPRPICYCFGHSYEEIEDEVGRTGESSVPDDVRTRLKEEGCQCEETNPAGRCCLGTIGAAVAAAKSHFLGSALKKEATGEG